jgi:hypothetical protein
MKITPDCQATTRIVSFESKMRPPLQPMQPASPSADGRRRLFTVCALLVGLTGGLGWFVLNFSLDPAYRGLKCCDATIYVRLSENGTGFAWNHSSGRIFGYPFFLAIFRSIYTGATAFLLPAMLAQLAAYFVSCFALVYALRKATLKVPAIGLTLLLAHPALCGLAAVSLSDSLTTSVMSCALAVMVLLLNDSRFFKTKTFLLGVTCSVALSLRVSLSGFAAISCGLVALMLSLESFRETRSLLHASKKSLTFVGVYLLGFLPLYSHLITNCYNAHHQLCIVPPTEVSRAMIESFNYGLNYSRMWGIIGLDGSFVWGSTDDKFIFDCRFDSSNPVASLFACYQRDLSTLPTHFFSRIRGLFDYHHLNPYAATVTTLSELWILRSFSIVGYLGVAASLALFAGAFFAGKARQQIYLLFPALYLALQVHFHAEARYMMPVTPLLFILGMTALCSNPFPKRWHAWIVWGLALILCVNFVLRVQVWDSMALAKFGSL